MQINKDKLNALHGYFEGSSDAVDKKSADKAIFYKKEVCKNYISLNSDSINSQLPGAEFYVTRKYDGEMNLLFVNGDEAVIINRSGRVRQGLACIEDAKETLKAAGVNKAIFAAELFVEESNGRTRVFNVLEALADKNKTGTLWLAVFDIIELNGESFKANSYKETYDKAKELFAKSRQCITVECTICKTKADVKKIYTELVEEDGAEGIVVRTELPLVYKVKPRYTIDVVIVGYSEGETKGQIRSLLIAMMPKEGEYQIIGKTGGGLNEEMRTEMFRQLEPMVMDSQYIETDSNHVAYHMVKPEIVIEIMINDVLFETSSGPLTNPILTIKEGAYAHKANINGISVIYPVFARFREDKKAVYDDVRLSQINAFSYVENIDSDAQVSGKSSEILRREVYKKLSGTKLMVQKFVVWKTNKPEPDFPAYVFHYTNYSSERNDPLQRDVTISNDEKQIMEIFVKSIEKNIKKGWEPV